VTTWEELEEILIRAKEEIGLVDGFTTLEGWARIRGYLSHWRTVYRLMEPAERWAHGIPILLDADLPPDVIEFRDRAGNVLERITLDPQR
jgi:hypothetical protein